LKATQPASFFIRIVVKRHDHRKNVFLENTKTKEKLVIKAISKHGDVLLLISRHPMDVTNAWIAQNQKEVLDWNFDKVGRQIRLNRILVIGMEMTKDN
jgi:WD40 repeat protein